MVFDKKEDKDEEEEEEEEEEEKSGKPMLDAHIFFLFVHDCSYLIDLSLNEASSESLNLIF